jgi:hypothetical protein
MTVLGQQSVAELIDLLKDKDYLVAQTQSAYNAQPQVVDTSDPLWATQWAAFMSRWNAARSSAQTAIDLAKLNIFVSNSLLAAQSEYDGILKALQQTPGTVQTGDFDDLSLRLQKLVPVDYSQAPQPDQTIDADLTGYQAADTAVKTVEAGEKAAGNAIKIGLGAVPWYVWAGGALVLGLVIKKEIID